MPRTRGSFSSKKEGCFRVFFDKKRGNSPAFEGCVCIETGNLLHARPAKAAVGGGAFYRGFPVEGPGAPGSSRPTDGVLGVRWASRDGPVGTPAPTDGLSGVRQMSVGRAHNTRKGHAASVRRQSRQRLRCVRPYKRYTNRHGGICGTGPTQHPTSPGGKSKRGRQSGSGRPQQIQRRGHALKTPSAKQKPPPPRPKHRAKPTRRSTEAAPRPMVLRGTGVRTVPRLRRG